MVDLQRRLLLLAAAFLIVNSVVLSISPAVTNRTWDTSFLWQHWFGVLIWLLGFFAVHLVCKKYLPDSDPYFIPIAALLSGWGLLTVWRLYPDLGLRQSIWLAIAVGILVTGIRFHHKFLFIRRFKYLWLTGCLLLTASTFFWGTNPMGIGPEMWLGCCGLYLQPSEPLKFMLIAYLAAYLADQQPFLLLSTVRTGRVSQNGQSSPVPSGRTGLLPLLAPTLVMAGMALLVLLIQRDLGTATVFLLLYAIIVYAATGRSRVIWLSAILLVLAFTVGYQLFEVVRIRMEAWLNPLLDPTGDSYQIVQSMIALANGELFGRGLGIGYPGLVPVSHSDFIFTSIVEESGLLGAIVIDACLVIFFFRGILVSLRSADAYRRLLSVGLTTYLVVQSILIIGGNVRLVPLTGITLPFMSYGGSSLVVSFLSLLFLVIISQKDEGQPAGSMDLGAYRNISTVFLSVLLLVAAFTGIWTVLRSPGLLERTDNPRRTISDSLVQRGAILDRQNFPISESTGRPGNYERQLLVPSLSNIIGYTNPIYGQSGLEASMDSYLRGNDGNPPGSIWWHRLVFGFPPIGRSIRTSLDLNLQQQMDGHLQEYKAAGILINAQTGEILAMSSYPTFDANKLELLWEELIINQDAPLVNRVIQGQYPLGELSTGIFLRLIESQQILSSPRIRLPVEDLISTQVDWNLVSPLQVVLMSAVISGGGIQPAPLLVTAVNKEPEGWVIQPPLDYPLQVISGTMAEYLGRLYEVPQLTIWQESAIVEKEAGGYVSWYVAGSSPDWEGTPYSITVLLESDNETAAVEIGQSLLSAAMKP